MNNEKAQRVIHHFTFEFVFTEFIDKNTITACKTKFAKVVFTGVCLSTEGDGMHGRGAYMAEG